MVEVVAEDELPAEDTSRALRSNQLFDPLAGRTVGADGQDVALHLEVDDG